MYGYSRSLKSRADSASKKLSKINPGERGYQKQADVLSDLREEIRTLDAEIVDEGISLGDWKHTQAREWMGILFGGLLECSEKGVVVATFGRTIIQHVPTEETQQGPSRPHYSGHSLVELAVAEAERKLHSISLVREAGDETARLPDQWRIGDIPENLNNSRSGPHEISDYGERYPHSRSLRPQPPYPQPTGPSPLSSSSLIRTPPSYKLTQKLAAEEQIMVDAEFAKRLQDVEDTEMQKNDRWVVKRPSLLCRDLDR